MLRTKILAVLLGGFALPMAAVAAVPFTDLEEDGWYVEAVNSLAQAHIVSGYRDATGAELGLFGPNDKVNIAEMLKMGLLAAKRPLPRSGVPSNLSAQGTWAAPYVNAAARLRFVLLTDNLLDVFRPATRGEVVQTFLEAFAIPLKPAQSQLFKDVYDDSRHGPAITTAYKLGFFKGDLTPKGNPTWYARPEDPINRAEVAVMLKRFVDHSPSGAPDAPPAPIVAQPSTPAASSSAPSAEPTPVPTPVVTPAQPPGPVTAATYRVAVYSVNIRTGASMEYRTIRSLYQGDLVTLVAKVDDAWAEIQLADGTKGFVVLASIAPVQQFDTGTTISGSVTTAVNLRTRADQSSTAIDSVPAGTKIIILDQSNATWTRIRLPDGREGYVAAKYVKVE